MERIHQARSRWRPRNGVLFLLCLCTFLYNGLYVGQMCNDNYGGGGGGVRHKRTSGSVTSTVGRLEVAAMDRRRPAERKRPSTDLRVSPPPSGSKERASGSAVHLAAALASPPGTPTVRSDAGDEMRDRLQVAPRRGTSLQPPNVSPGAMDISAGTVTSLSKSAAGNNRQVTRTWGKFRKMGMAAYKRQRHLHKKLLKKARQIQDGHQTLDTTKSRLQTLAVTSETKTFKKPEKISSALYYSNKVENGQRQQSRHDNRFYYKLLYDVKSGPPVDATVTSRRQSTRYDDSDVLRPSGSSSKTSAQNGDRAGGGGQGGQTRHVTTKPSRQKSYPGPANTTSALDQVDYGDYLDEVIYVKGNVTARRRLPRALIVGVKKGGTRALLEFIRLHPEVKAVGPETHFFDRYYDKGLAWYRQQMPPTSDVQLTMEKTPSYFVTREVPKRIRGMSRDIKLLVVLRDPVTRAISDYAQTVSKRPHMKSFDELAFLNNATGLVDTSWGAIKIGVYARHLEHWLQFFPLEQFHFVSGERLIKDPAGEMAKVQDFLGIRRYINDNHFYFNETKGFPCLRKAEGNPRCLGKTKGRTHPVVDNSTIANLRDFFRPFNMKFYQMTGVDFGWP